MSDTTDRPLLDRRRLLGGAAALGVTAPILAACGSDEPTTGSTGTPQDSPAESGSPTQSSGGGDGAAGGELVATADVPVGGGVVLDDQKVVVTQPAKGEFKAFTAVCTHQGCVVSSVKDNNITCECHGSQFSAEDGSVVNGPATSPLAEVEVTVQNGSVLKG